MDYKEMAAIVKERGDQILEERKARAVRIKKIASSAAGVCAAAAAALVIWTGDPADKGPDKDAPGTNIVTQEEQPDDVQTDIPVTDHKVTVYTTASVSTEQASTVVTTPAVTQPAGISATVPVTYNEPISIATENIPEKSVSVNSEAPAVIVTTAVTSVPQITVTSAVPVSTEDQDNEMTIERKICMKKLSSFLASCAVATTSLTAMTNIAYAEKPVTIPLDKYYYRDGAIDAITRGDFDIDINSDGKFDIFDCYAFYRSIDEDGGAAEEMSQKALENGDYNNDGLVNKLDFNDLVYYYAINNKASAEIYELDYFTENCPDTYTETADGIAERFFNDLHRELALVKADYWMARDAFERSLVFDIDDDGEFTMKDLHELYIFFVNEGYVHRNDLPIYGKTTWGFSGGREYMKYDKMVTLPDEDMEACFFDLAKLEQYILDNKLYPDVVYNIDNPYHPLDDGGYAYVEEKTKSFLNNRFMTYAYTYFFETHPFLEEYVRQELDENGEYRNVYFDQFFPNSKNYEMDESLREYFTTIGVRSIIKIDEEKLYSEAEKYIADVREGNKAAPDVDGNGKIDSQDEMFIEDYIEYIYGVSYMSEWIYSEPGWRDYYPIDPKEIIESELDLNGDGVSGDVYDLLIAQTYFDINRYENAQKIRESYEVNTENPGYAEDSEDEQAEEKTEAEVTSEEENSAVSEAQADAADLPRSGDASNDGQLKMNDAVAIMQTISNPDNYQLSEEGFYNADVYNTGDGVTPNDALKVQRILLDLE